MSGGWKLPSSMRDAFKEPLGTELKESELREHKDSRIVAVGDVVSLTMARNGIRPVLSVYDGYTERHEMTEFSALVKKNRWEEKVVKSPAGVISREMDDAVRNALSGGTGLIRVEGEEDLALMPCILYAPEGTEIIYGWPGKGMMIVTTDDVIRKRVKELWNTMEDFE
jgi:uncharacterized protein (UPF0218 family)